MLTDWRSSRPVVRTKTILPWPFDPGSAAASALSVVVFGSSVGPGHGRQPNEGDHQAGHDPCDSTNH